MAGQFISFEGGEGAGKTTHIKRLAHRLKTLGFSCLVTREPGGTPLGEKIRGLFLEQSLDIQTETLLVLAARRLHLNTVILPALEKGLWVLCDRYIDSHLVYQSLVHNKNPQWIVSLHKTFNMLVWPHLTFLFQEPLGLALSRRHANKESCNRFDRGSFAFHQKIRKSFASLAKDHPSRIVLVPQRQPLKSGTDFLFKTLQQRWPDLIVNTL